MISEERTNAIEEYKFEVCPQMGMQCTRCICADCPRDCKECEQSGVVVHSERCIYIGNEVYKNG